MPHPTPFDLIRKASRHATATDRWAALKVNTQQRAPLSPPQKEPFPEPPPQEESFAQPPIPPFPPPHHPYVDEVALRHEQARKNAMPLQSWSPSPQNAPRGQTMPMAPTQARASEPPPEKPKT